MSSPLPNKKPAEQDQAVTAMADQDQLEADNAAAGNPTPGSPQDTGAPANPLDTVDQAAVNEDWTKIATWDVTDAAGKTVTTLDGLAEVLDTDRTSAAGMLLGSPMSAAAPAELIAEANEEVNPAGQVSLLDEFDDVVGAAPADAADDEQSDDDVEDEDVDDEDDIADDTDEAVDAEDTDAAGNEDEDEDAPPWAKKKSTKAFPWQKAGAKGPDTGSSTRKETIAAGAFVSWSGGKGKVEVVVTNGGKVPNVDTDITGTKAAPACRVRLYEQSGDDWKATDKRVAVKASNLKTIPPLGAAKFSKKDATAGLILLVTQQAGPPGSGQPTAEAIREVFVRGQQAWPGESKTLLSAPEWALGRARAFVDKATGYDVPNYIGDDDLLP